MNNKYIKLSDLRKVSGIGNKTIERVKDQLLQVEIDNSYVSEYNAEINLDYNTIHNGDCLELMNGIRDKSVDMILCDLPYGTTQNKWDSVIDLDKIWLQYSRIIKDNGAIVLTAQTPFDKVLGASNIDMMKYEWIWEKHYGTGFLNSKKMPLKKHENILVFYKNLPTYNPQGLIYNPKMKHRGSIGSNYGKAETSNYAEYENYPDSILKFKHDKEKLHPTQKPVALFEYLINTYTNKGDVVLDNCMGSGTTAIAAVNLGREYIGIELDEAYCIEANCRVIDHITHI